MTGQLSYWWLLAFLSGVLLCVAAITIVNGKYFAVKRKKTKLGLVKVAGAGLKFGDGEAAEGAEPSVADGGSSADKPAGSEPPVEKPPVEEVFAEKPPVEEVFAEKPPVEEVFAEKPPVEEVFAEKSAAGKASAEKPSTETPAVGDSSLAAVEPAAKPTVVEPAAKPTAVEPAAKPVAKEPAKDADGSPSPKLPPPSPLPSRPLPGIRTVMQRKRIPETVKMKERKVILAEDIEVNRELIAMYFEGSGVKFEFAVNGREVCEKFEGDPGAYSLILMDIQMPVMDGYEATRRIRALDVDWAKQIPIIAMTGNDMKEDIDLCFDAGMDDHVFKPIDMELLQDKVFDIITSNTE